MLHCCTWLTLLPGNLGRGCALHRLAHQMPEPTPMRLWSRAVLWKEHPHYLSWPTPQPLRLCAVTAIAALPPPPKGFAGLTIGAPAAMLHCMLLNLPRLTPQPLRSCAATATAVPSQPKYNAASTIGAPFATQQCSLPRSTLSVVTAPDFPGLHCIHWNVQKLFALAVFSQYAIVLWPDRAQAKRICHCTSW